MSDTIQVEFNSGEAKRKAAEFLHTVAAHYLLAPDYNTGGIIADHNDTLDHGEHGAKLQEFLCDALDAGIPVCIMSGKNNVMPENLARRFAAFPKGEGNLATLSKPFAGFKPLARCLVFDDQEAMRRIAEDPMVGAKAYDVANPEAAEFLTAYCSLSPKDRCEVLAPLRGAHYTRKALLPYYQIAAETAPGLDLASGA